MLGANVPGALVLLFIVAMVWLRTRLRYPRSPGAGLRLTRTGASYFVALLVLLVVGWFAAPLLVLHLGLAALLSATLTRAVWFLAVYLAFIPLHRVLIARDTPVFRQTAQAHSRDP
jgi:hypothetical protein